MSAIQITTILLSLLSGIALFLFGMQLMGDGLKRAAGKQLELTLYKLTSSPLKGILLGAAVTAVIQSSSATTVMVVGFVNAGMMKVAQSIGIIMGANIGTSITGWILCLSYIEGSGSAIASLLSTTTISAVVAIAGILMQKLAKKESYKNVGDIMLGFAILMTGMKMMSGAVEPLKSSPAFINTLTMFSNPIAGIIVGVLFTAVLQSASASVGILQALSVTGAITFATALPITMGIGVGAACPVLISSIGTNKNGRRTALIYLLNDLLGMIIGSIVFYSMNAVLHFSIMTKVMDPMSVALLNTLFRLATILVLCPFIPAIEKLVFLLVKDTEEDLEDQADFDLLESRFLKYPDVAINQAHAVMNSMAKKSRKNVLRALKLMDSYSQKSFDKVQEKEGLIDRYEEKLGTYLMQISGNELTLSQSKQVSIYLHVIGDLERIGDFSADIAYACKEIENKKITFSDSGFKEIKVLRSAAHELLDMTTQCFINNDLELAKRVEPLHDIIEALCSEAKLNHVERLRLGNCVLDHGFVFNDLVACFLGIAEHCNRIAVVLIKMEADDFATHEYLRNRRKQSEHYMRDYREFVNIYDFGAPVAEEKSEEIPEIDEVVVPAIEPTKEIEPQPMTESK